MFATRSELLEKIRLGEDSYLELKEVRFAGEKLRGPEQNDLADELAAFANSRGGVLVLGVHDKSRDITGIAQERLDAVESLVRQSCEDSIKPALAPLIERLTLPDAAKTEKAVLRVEVLRSLFVHQSPSGYLHRVGSSKRPMQPDYLARLFQQRSQSRIIRFDEQIVPQAVLDDLVPELWQRFIGDRTLDDREGFLQKLAMARVDEEGVLRPSVAGVLMACRHPQQFLPNAYIQAVAYRGSDLTAQTEVAYQRDAQDIVGPLDQQITQSCDFVRKNMRVAARKQEGREDVPQFDMLAVFEAVTNAVAHRDYSIYGSKIRLRLFDDRLEIYSPGAIPNTMTVESLAFRQAARNEAITSLLARCPVQGDASEIIAHRSHMMDKRGEGVPIILARTQRLSGKSAIYRLVDETELILTIPAADGMTFERTLEKADT
ncbi:MAG: ATP-binding protein [Rhodocyclaceae bacterium]|nr:ATP-binding protein [Rhodocyclaceae bacterium]